LIDIRDKLIEGLKCINPDFEIETPHLLTQEHQHILTTLTKISRIKFGIIAFLLNPIGSNKPQIVLLPQIPNNMYLQSLANNLINIRQDIFDDRLSHNIIGGMDADGLEYLVEVLVLRLQQVVQVF
jgi:hypothetical protein